MNHKLYIILIFTALFTSCRAKKEIAVSDKADIDSTASIRTSGYILKIDTALRRINFAFDTLDIAIERQVAADTTEIPCQRGQSRSSLRAMPSAAGIALCERVRIRAVKGSVIDNRKQIVNDIEGYNRLDTVAYKRATATSRAEHTATTSLAEPPNTSLIFTALGTVIILVIGVFVYLRRRH